MSTESATVILGVLFLVLFVVLLGIGDGAPEALEEFLQHGSSGADVTFLKNEGKNRYVTTFTLSRENQLFWVDMRVGLEGLELVQTPETVVVDISATVFEGTTDGGLEHSDNFSLKATSECEEREEWCDWFFLWNRDFVDQDSYHIIISFPDPVEYSHEDSSTTTSTTTSTTLSSFDVETRVTAINPEFTRFVIAFKYLWLVVTLMVMFCPCGVGFRSALNRQRKDTGQSRTYHQRWASVLLWALVWFNDPFVAASVYSNFAPVFSAVFILSASVFVFLILLYWLCFLSDLRFMREGESVLAVRRGICCYWLPKVLLTFAIGVTVFGSYMYYRFENSISFDYTGVSDEKEAAEALAGVLGLLLAVYMIWVLLLVLTSCGRLRQVSPSYILLYFITLLSCLVAIVGVFVAAFYPYSTSEIAFVSIHGLMNMYVWILAGSFTPVRVARSDGGLGLGDKALAADTGTAHHGGLGNGWDDATDSDFKAVEL